MSEVFAHVKRPNGNPSQSARPNGKERVPMANENLDRVYTASGDKEMRKIYDEWAEQYDSDV